MIHKEHYSVSCTVSPESLVFSNALCHRWQHMQRDVSMRLVECLIGDVLKAGLSYSISRHVYGFLSL